MAGIVAVLVAADQVTKSLVLTGRIAGGTGWAAVRLVRNTGSAGGLAAGHPVLVFLLALAITAFAVTVALRSRRMATALSFSFVVAGAIGNLSDRVFRAPGLGRGAVVDWIHFAGGGGSLNLSDLAINVGVFGAVIAMLATREKAGSTKPVRDATGN
jgi:signal peptidase II